MVFFFLCSIRRSEVGDIRQNTLSYFIYTFFVYFKNCVFFFFLFFCTGGRVLKTPQKNFFNKQKNTNMFEKSFISVYIYGRFARSRLLPSLRRPPKPKTHNVASRPSSPPITSCSTLSEDQKRRKVRRRRRHLQLTRMRRRRKTASWQCIYMSSICSTL